MMLPLAEDRLGNEGKTLYGLVYQSKIRFRLKLILKVIHQWHCN